MLLLLLLQPLVLVLLLLLDLLLLMLQPLLLLLWVLPTARIRALLREAFIRETLCPRMGAAMATGCR